MRRTTAGLLLAAALPGCNRTDLVPVCGKVTLDGAPLAGATVTFQPRQPGNPEPGIGSYAKTDADGRFALKTMDREVPGARPGRHLISVYGADPEPGAKRPPAVPDRYNLDSKVVFEVPAGGTDAANFDLTTKTGK